MYPEDRVLVAYVPEPQDFKLIEEENWYRIPQKNAPKGLHAEYVAFYFGGRFGPQKWAIHCYAQNLGHELVTRLALRPQEPQHPRANDLYYKVQLGPLQRLSQPIISLRWRRLTFLHTTWDRFLEARELNDLVLDGGIYVDRLYATLKERGLQAERIYEQREHGEKDRVRLMVPCRDGRIVLGDDDLPRTQDEVQVMAEAILHESIEKGGALDQALQETPGAQQANE